MNPLVESALISAAATVVSVGGTDRGTMASERNEELVMGDQVVPERPGGRQVAAQDPAGVPAMPVIFPREQVAGYPYPLLDTLSPTIGWHYQSQGRGGPAFVLIRRTGLGGLRVVESFPLTEDGWARVWQSLIRQNPAAAPQLLATLSAREAKEAGSRYVSELDAR